MLSSHVQQSVDNNSQQALSLARQRITELEVVDVIADGYKSASVFVLDRRGDAYAFGRNHFGNLGVGSGYEITSPVKINFSEQQAKVKQIKIARDDLTLFLLESGDVYFSGRLKGEIYAQESIVRKYCQSSPVKINGLENIIDILTADNSGSFFLDKNGRIFVYRMDDIDYPELGYYVVSDLIAEKKLAFKPKQIIATFAGIYYLAETGELYFADSIAAVPTPIQVELSVLLSMVQVHHQQGSEVLFLDISGNVSYFDKKKQELVRMGLPEKIKQIASDGERMYFLALNGKVITGNLIARELTSIDKLMVLDLPYPIKRIESAQSAAYFYAASGETLVSGNNAESRLGWFTKNYHLQVPTLIANLQHVKKAVTSKENAYYLMASGELQACGDNYYGQLGLGKRSSSLSLHTVPYFSDRMNELRLSCLTQYSLTLDQLALEALRADEISHQQFKCLFLQVMTGVQRDEVLARSSLSANKFALIVAGCENTAGVQQNLPQIEDHELADVCRFLQLYVNGMREMHNQSAPTYLQAALATLNMRLLRHDKIKLIESLIAEYKVERGQQWAGTSLFGHFIMQEKFAAADLLIKLIKGEITKSDVNPRSLAAMQEGRLGVIYAKCEDEKLISGVACLTPMALG